MKRPSAYHGRGWVARGRPSPKEGSNSEYLPLESVLLYNPGNELSAIRDPNSVQHLEKINVNGIKREFNALAATYRRLGIAVHWIDRDAFDEKYFNLMYVRDLFWMTPDGAVIARMASRPRAGEEKFAAHALAGLAVPILRSVNGHGLFEGADALWVNPSTILCGLGNRTNPEAFRQLKRTMSEQGVRCIGLKLPRTIQHLLGVLQIVDRRTALLRSELVSTGFKQKLKALGISIIDVPEWDEVSRRQAMNIVTVAPRTVVMPKNSPKLRQLLKENRIRVAAEVSIDEIIKGAGGIACATGVVRRKLAKK